MVAQVDRQRAAAALLRDDTLFRLTASAGAAATRRWCRRDTQVQSAPTHRKERPRQSRMAATVQQNQQRLLGPLRIVAKGLPQAATVQRCQRSSKQPPRRSENAADTARQPRQAICRRFQRKKPALATSKASPMLPRRYPDQTQPHHPNDATAAVPLACVPPKRPQLGAAYARESQRAHIAIVQRDGLACIEVGAPCDRRVVAPPRSHASAAPTILIVSVVQLESCSGRSSSCSYGGSTTVRARTNRSGSADPLASRCDSPPSSGNACSCSACCCGRCGCVGAAWATLRSSAARIKCDMVPRANGRRVSRVPSTDDDHDHGCYDCAQCGCV